MSDTFDATDPAQVAAAYHRERAAREAAEAERDALLGALLLERELRQAAQELCTRSILPSSDSHALTEAQFQGRAVSMFDGPFQRRVAEATNAALAQADGEVTP